MGFIDWSCTACAYSEKSNDETPCNKCVMPEEIS